MVWRVFSGADEPRPGFVAVNLLSKIPCQQLSVLLLAVHLASATAASEVSDSELLSYGEVIITERDLYFYLKERLDPRVYEAALYKPEAMRNAILNLYVLRRVSEVAAQRGLFEETEANYFEADGLARESVARYVEIEANQRKDATDWEALARERYLAEVAGVDRRQEVRVRHILIKSENRTFDELVARVNEVQAGLNQGADFTELAKQYSEDRSVEMNEGDLGFIGKGATVPAFETVAFGMGEPGEISSPTLSPFGVHFIQYLERRTRAVVPFEEVKEELVSALKADRENTLRGEILLPYRTEPASQLVELDQNALAAKMLSRLQASEES